MLGPVNSFIDGEERNLWILDAGFLLLCLSAHYAPYLAWHTMYIAYKPDNRAEHSKQAFERLGMIRKVRGYISVEDG